MMPGEVQIISWLQYAIIKCTQRGKMARAMYCKETAHGFRKLGAANRTTLRAKLNGSSEVCRELTRL